MMRVVLLLTILLPVLTGAWGQTNIKDEIGNVTPIYVKDGNVGLGMSNPQKRLQISDGLGMRVSLGVHNLSAGNREPAVFISRWTGVNSNYQSYILHALSNSATGYGLAFSSTGTHLDNDFTNFQTRMFLGQDGNVGIGTTNPIAKLHLNNKNNSYGAILAQATEANFQLYTKTLTTQPTFVESFRLGMKYGSDERNGYISFYRGGGTYGGYLGFSTNGIERMHIATNGNVGIGTTSPSAKLQVAGNILCDKPTSVNDWNTLWQSGFFEGYQKNNAPNNDTWYWGINMNHSSNNPDYRYGGQILIRNSPSTPTMYFRSRDKNGAGAWAKIVNSVGNQEINGDLIVDGIIKTQEIRVENIAAINLKLEGDLATKSITVKANGNTADFVFEEDYNLKDLSEVETYIKEHKHLPEIPSASEMEASGVNLAEMNKLLLQKVEELTLYTIKQQNELNEKDTELESINKELESIKELLQTIVNHQE